MPTLNRLRAATVSALFLFGPIVGLIAVTSCAPVQKDISVSALPLTLVRASFSDLAGWDKDDHAAALDAFRRSCRPIIHGAPPPATVGGVAIKAEAWQGVCDKSFRVRPGDAALSKRFFERNFTPFAASAGGARAGLFTGYYEASLKGAPAQSATYTVPLYGPPEGLVSVDLGLFDAALAGRTLTGRLNGKRVLPLPDRAAIEGGALEGEGLELLWVSSEADAFFLHVQGSGRVEMEDGTSRRVGFAGRNGHAYTPIGRVLIERGEIAAADMSMQAIRDWIAANPEQGRALMAENKSYIFFRFLDGDGPVGASGVELTAGRSLAVDRDRVPFGVPVWLETADPLDRTQPLTRLLVAQDAGAAIKGPVRGDVFWGYGDGAARRAGNMKDQGRIHLLLPGAP